MNQAGWSHVLWVGLGGFFGSSLRFLIGGWVQRLAGFSSFPWGTLTVNGIGCLALGLLGGLAESRQILGPAQRAFMFIGVLGGFTTFSTFAYETVGLAQDSGFKAMLNAALHLIVGLLAAAGGYALSRSL